MYPVHYITLDINNSYSAQYTVMKGRTDTSRTLNFKLRNGSQIIPIPQDAVAVLCGEYEATVAATEDAAETTATKTVALSCKINENGTASVSLISFADCTGGEVVLVLKVTDGVTTLCAPKIRVLLDSTAASVPEDEDAVTFLTAQRTAAEAAAKAAQAAASAAQSRAGTALYKDGSTETPFGKGILGLGLKLNETAQTIYVETFDKTAASDDEEKPVSYKDFKAGIGNIETALAGI